MMRSMLWLASIVLKAIYLLLPVGSLAAFALRDRAALKRQIAAGWIGGAIVAGAVLAAYVVGIGGDVSYGQIALTLYLGAGLMLFLKSVDALVRLGVRRVTRLGAGEIEPQRWRVMLAGLLRVVVFASFALPWVMSVAMVYRPRVVPVETPAEVLQASYADADFRAEDGTRIAGWFVPAEQTSRTTVILCHGLGSNKTGLWIMMKALRDAGLNVMPIDLRAHGASGGQITTFGLKEADDVRAAVDWVKRAHSAQSERLFVVGASAGGAAALSAAAEDRRIDGVVTLGAFDSLADLSRDVSSEMLVPPLNWIVRAVGLSIASLHAGVDLVHYAPHDAMGKIWPRPVLVIHGAHDEIIPYEHGRRLYDAAYEPREDFFPPGTHNSVLENRDVIERIIRFVREAQAEPIV